MSKEQKTNDFIDFSEDKSFKNTKNVMRVRKNKTEKEDTSTPVLNLETARPKKRVVQRKNESSAPSTEVEKNGKVQIKKTRTKTGKTLNRAANKDETPPVFHIKDFPRLHSALKKWDNLDIFRLEPHFSPQLRNFRIKGKTAKTQQNPLALTPKLALSAGKLQKRSVKVIPLGGLCEVGRNMTAIEYGDDMIVVDVGVAFPDAEHPGIDKIIPNMNYVVQNKHKLRGVFITHGHEDHIGAIAHFVRLLGCIIYAPPLAAALVSLKLEEERLLNKVDLRVVKVGDRIKAGVLNIEYIHVNHSIADSCALAIRTPLGTILHTGDFKIDYTPIDGGPIDLPRLATIGSEGVLLLLCESTNVEKSGFSMSESKVGEYFAEAFGEAKGRIIVATFSSNVHRIQQIITAAELYKRKVALVGRSMQNVFRSAAKLGYIRAEANTMIDLDKISNYPENEIVIITTGSQGEPMAALTRMAFSDHRQVDIYEKDTVIISSTPIPGNEKALNKVINELYKKHAKVIYSAMAEVHVSGHAYREEIKMMHQLIRPKYFMPVHGEYRMLYEHGKLANEMGQPWDTIFLMNNGDILQITEQGAKIADYFSCEPVLIDGKSATTLDNRVLNERLTMAEEGVVSVSLVVDVENQVLMANPFLQMRGFVYQDKEGEIVREVRHYVEQFVRKTEDQNKPLLNMLNSNAFRDRLNDLLYNKTKRKPILLISIIEV